ncbi:MAG: hypothetical protein ACN2B6_00515 [Rickettsiales bacterium]
MDSRKEIMRVLKAQLNDKYSVNELGRQLGVCGSYISRMTTETDYGDNATQPSNINLECMMTLVEREGLTPMFDKNLRRRFKYIDESRDEYTIAHRLKILIAQSGLNYIDAANICFTTPGTMRRWVKGPNHDKGKIRTICRAFARLKNYVIDELGLEPVVLNVCDDQMLSGNRAAFEVLAAQAGITKRCDQAVMVGMQPKVLSKMVINGVVPRDRYRAMYSRVILNAHREPAYNEEGYRAVDKLSRLEYKRAEVINILFAQTGLGIAKVARLIGRSQRTLSQRLAGDGSTYRMDETIEELTKLLLDFGVDPLF